MFRLKEIKFRAKYKDPKIKNWAYGSLDSFEWNVGAFKYRLSKFFELLEQGFLDPETVGQYTGLKDKKRTKEYPEGQGIYEDDIVKLAENTYGETESPISCVVKWNDKGFYQLWRNGLIHWNIWKEDAYYNKGYRKNIEVIGNTTENPKLLSEKE